MHLVFQAKGVRWDFPGVRILAVLNATPDSFSDGGLFDDPARAREWAQAAVAEGADAIDIGAESSRPGAPIISESLELARLLPVLEAVRKAVSVPISVDTTKAAVAEEALAQGASIVNDTSGLARDPRMGDVVREAQAGVILMHMRGVPQTMQWLASYEDVVADVRRELENALRRSDAAGISRTQTLLDPGFGFAKTSAQSLALLKHLAAFEPLGRPLVAGVSRKSFIGEVTERPVREREFGTAAAVALAVERGAQVIRVHDVRAMRDAVRLTQAVLES